MKKLYLLLPVLFASFSVFAGAGCIIDSTNTDFFAPRPDSLPCVERGVMYNQTLQIAVPSTIDLQDFGSPLPFVLTVDSVVITGVNGLPTGLSYASVPFNGVFYGGSKGCAQVYGTTNDPTGRYPITFEGTFTAHGNAFPPFFDGDTTLDFATLQGLSQGMFDLFVDVINPGDDCRPVASGINNLNSELNTLLSVYPNPTNGMVNVALNTGRRITGEVCILNVAGQKVASVNIDVIGKFNNSFDLTAMPAGLYTVLLKTTEGIAAKNVSVE
jgi:hypothetical protein